MKKGMIICGVVGGAGAVLMGLCVVSAAVAMAMAGNSNGERIAFKNGELYYTENVSKEQADSLADYLEELYGDLENQKTFQLDRRGDDMIVRMCANSQALETNKLDASFMALEMLIQQTVFTDNNVVVELCDQDLETRKSFDNFPKNEK